MRRRISIRGCVRPSVLRFVRPSVRPSVRMSRVIFRRVLGASCAVYPALFVWMLWLNDKGQKKTTFDKDLACVRRNEMIQNRLAILVHLPFGFFLGQGWHSKIAFARANICSKNVRRFMMREQNADREWKFGCFKSLSRSVSIIYHVKTGMG